MPARLLHAIPPRRGALGASLALHGAVAGAVALPFSLSEPPRLAAIPTVELVLVTAPVAGPDGGTTAAPPADMMAGPATPEPAPDTNAAPTKSDPIMPPGLAEARLPAEPLPGAATSGPPLIPPASAAERAPELPAPAEPPPPAAAEPPAPAPATAPATAPAETLRQTARPARAAPPRPPMPAEEARPRATPPSRIASSQPAPLPSPQQTPLETASRPLPGAAAADPAAPATAAAAPASPVVITAPRYRRPPTPAVYPPRAIELGLSGTVLVRARVGTDGETEEMRVWRSSGHPLLDAAALAAVRRWAFEPASVGGQRVEAWVEVPIHFRLN